jgi:integrase
VRGSIVKRGKTYSVVVELDRDPVTQKRRQKWHGGFRTKKEAEAELAELIGTVNRGTYIPKSRQTFAEFVVEWLAAIRPTVRPGDALQLRAESEAARDSEHRRNAFERG